MKIFDKEVFINEVELAVSNEYCKVWAETKIVPEESHIRDTVLRKMMVEYDYSDVIGKTEYGADFLELEYEFCEEKYNGFESYEQALTYFCLNQIYFDKFGYDIGDELENKLS